jgi:putative ABC transport system ATP-binding protein
MIDIKKAPQTNAILRGESLRKTYRRGRDDVVALDGVDVTVAPGELVAIMGPSGCGKSTLLHLLCGIDTPSAGRVLLRGADLGALDAEARAAARRTHMGLIFQAHALLPGLTVAENVALPLALAGVTRRERDARAAVLLAMVGLADRAGDLPDDLSGGQRQRVALARALANAPVVALADEPTGSLDSATARDVLDAMVGLLRAQGTALVMVTHDPHAAARADRVIRLRDGHIDTAWSARQDIREEVRS